MGAHVAGFVLQNGAIPDGNLVRHRCDNRACVRGEHLLAGTQSDNMRDAVERGRQKPGGCRGERVGTSRLTEEQVCRIKSRLASGERGRVLAREFGVNDDLVSKIKLGISWRHVA
ncbi:HNH endonuclease [Plantactinospora alkalitolerans]|uniref:HNH endonuclease n=1 Tax=Plantactinospora alkalitolerans TaxID=2789879 RepID=UPI00389A1FAA